MGEFEKYICTTLEKIHLQPGPTPEEKIMLAKEGLRIQMENMLWLDSDVLPGGYYGEAAWVWPKTYPNQISDEELKRRTTENAPMAPHYHEFPELLSWCGSNPDDPEDITSMIMLMGDEEIHLEGSWVAYCPAGMYHMPETLTNKKVSSNPVYHWTSGPGMYGWGDNDTKTEHTPVGEPPIFGSPRKSTNENLKYFVMVGDQKETPVKIDFMTDLDTRYHRHLAYIDETIVPGCEFGCNAKFLLPGFPSKEGMRIMEPHTLPYGTTITMVALNYEALRELGATAELWIGGEKHLITSSFGAYIPPGVEQGPLIVRNMEKQLFFMTSNPVGEGIKKFPGGR